MARKGFGLGDYSRNRVLPGIYAGQAAQDEAQAAPYRAALEKAAYRDAGAQYGQGLDQISRSMATMGPLADSGAPTALKARLASSIYGAAAGRIGNTYADFLGSLMKQRQQYNYQMALMKQQKKMQQTGIGGVIGGIVGGAAGFIPGLGGLAGGGGGGVDISPYTNFAPPYSEYRY